jgi:HAD superfamily hydrolase (TIGR01509 family)
MKEAYIFDMDGTLIDSMPLWQNFGADYLRSLGKEPAPGLRDKTRALSFERTAECFVEDYQLDKTVEQVLQEWNEWMIRAYRELPMKKGALEFLQKNRDKTMVLFTANSGPTTQVIQEKFHLDDYFCAFFTADDVKADKNEPVAFERVCQRLGVAPKNCTVFEDSLYAMKGAKGAGCKVIAIQDEAFPQEEEAIRALADRYVEDFTQI